MKSTTADVGLRHGRGVRRCDIGAWQKTEECGFTYVLVLVMVVLMSIFAQTGMLLVSRQVQAENEKELLFRGQAYVSAIARYYDAGRSAKHLPSTLEDLVQDPRYALRRHMRRLYTDPMTGADWQLIRDPGGGIRGVYSSSERQALKHANFPPGLEDFAQAERYADWRFEFKPETRAANALAEKNN